MDVASKISLKPCLFFTSSLLFWLLTSLGLSEGACMYICIEKMLSPFAHFVSCHFMHFIASPYTASVLLSSIISFCRSQFFSSSLSHYRIFTLGSSFLDYSFLLFLSGHFHSWPAIGWEMSFNLSEISKVFNSCPPLMNALFFNVMLLSPCRFRVFNHSSMASYGHSLIVSRVKLVYRTGIVAILSWFHVPRIGKKILILS